MTSSKHPTRPPENADDLGADVPELQSDLDRNPGIGQSKGLSGADAEELEADNTLEGDVASDGAKGGGVDPDHLARTNK